MVQERKKENGPQQITQIKTDVPMVGENESTDSKIYQLILPLFFVVSACSTFYISALNRKGMDHFVRLFLRVIVWC